MYSLDVIPESSWIMPIPHYLQTDELPLDEREAIIIRKQAAKYTLLLRNLYKIGRVSTMFYCLDERENTLQGACSSHIDGKTLTYKLLRKRYYLPTLMKDGVSFVKKCDKCKRHVDLHQSLVKLH